jgi:hypothetical protein
VLPDPADLVDAAWDEDERRWVADYLDRGGVHGRVPLQAVCLLQRLS